MPRKKTSKAAETKAAAEVAKRRRGKQEAIPGTQPKVITELEGRAEDYAVTRDARCELSAKEKEQKQGLIAAMKRHGFTHGEQYRCSNGTTIELVVEKEKVKVRTAKAEAEDDEEDEDDEAAE